MSNKIKSQTFALPWHSILKAPMVTKGTLCSPATAHVRRFRRCVRREIPSVCGRKKSSKQGWPPLMSLR